MGAPHSIPRKTLTVDQFVKMGEAGILHEDDRVELIEGEMIQMPPIGIDHAYRVDAVNEYFVLSLRGTGFVSIQNPVVLPPDNMPQPDVIIFRPNREEYKHRYRNAHDVLLLIEVADSSLRYDRDIKVPIYAANGVAEVWVLDVNTEVLLVFRKLIDGGYTESLNLDKSQSVTPTLLPDVTIHVADLFG